MHTHHHEGQTAPDRPDRRLLWVLVLMLSFAFVEASAGWWSGSLALLGSVAALVSGTVIRLTEWTPIDPLLSLSIVVLILVSAVRISREALHVLIAPLPEGEALVEVLGTTFTECRSNHRNHFL